MGDDWGVKVSCGRWSDEPRAEGNCVSVSERGEEAGEQNLDWMNTLAPHASAGGAGVRRALLIPEA